LNTYEKYLGKFWYNLLRAPYPPFGENYDAHWNYISFEGKVVLDLGADYGSSAYYFWKKGATKVVAVEGNHESAEKLKKNASKYRFIIPVEKYVDSSNDFTFLINHYQPDLTKVDVEGSEIYLLTCKNETLVKVPEWLVECHSFEAYKQLRRKFSSLGFRVSSLRVNFRRGPVIVLIVTSKNG
jgi:precorrin-6B methylase 2